MRKDLSSIWQTVAIGVGHEWIGFSCKLSPILQAVAVGVCVAWIGSGVGITDEYAGICLNTILKLVLIRVGQPWIGVLR